MEKDILERLAELKERMDLDNFADDFYQTVDDAIAEIERLREAAKG